MATWETTVTITPSWWRGGTQKSANTIISKIDDRNSADTMFQVGEKIWITFPSGDFEGKFEGTFTWNDVSYPVVSWSSGSNSYWYAVGLPHTTTGLPSNLKSSTDFDTSSTFTVCFFPGTLIATPSGERKVEELISGDLVLIGDSGAIPATWFGRRFASAVSVKWIGRQTVSTIFGSAERLMPVRFAVGSLGGGGVNPLCRIAI